jgi:hypothetical protein
MTTLQQFSKIVFFLSIFQQTLFDPLKEIDKFLWYRIKIN